MEQFLTQLKPYSSLKVFKKGSNVYFQGEVPRKAMIVRDGIIRAYTITSTGEERIVALYGKNDILPLTWVLGETSNTLFYYDALSETRVLAVSKVDFNSILDANPDLVRMMLGFVANNYTAMLLRITGLEQSRAIEKIGFTLYYLLFRYGIESTPGQFTIDVKMSQNVIASLVGLTRESTTKNLKLLKDKKVIDYNSSTYTVNKQKLENFLGEDSFRDLSL